LEAIFNRWFSKARDRLRQIVFETSRIRGVTEITSLKDESNESKMAFYLFSLMFLVSLIFLSPDRILQTFTQMQSETGMFEKMQEVARVLKKLVPGLN